MKFQKKIDFDYEANGATAENGYVKWYEWQKHRTTVRIIGYAAVAVFFVLSNTFKEGFLAFGKTNQIISALAALLTLIVAVVPLHEILHLLVMSGGKLDKKCIITYGNGAVSAVYTAPLSRNRQIAALLCPVTVFAVIFGVAVFAATGVVRLYFIYLLVMSTLSSYTDIYMTVYILRHLDRNDIIFGQYKKSNK